MFEIHRHFYPSKAPEGAVLIVVIVESSSILSIYFIGGYICLYSLNANVLMNGTKIMININLKNDFRIRVVIPIFLWHGKLRNRGPSNIWLATQIPDKKDMHP